MKPYYQDSAVPLDADCKAKTEGRKLTATEVFDPAEPQRDKWGLTSAEALLLHVQGKYPPKNSSTPHGTKGISPMKPRKPIRKVSVKRSKEMALYAKLRKDYLAAHPICEVWLYENAMTCLHSGEVPDNAPRSQDIHHRAGRTGWRLNDVSHFLAVCRANHEWIHNNPSEARQKGYLV